jgi:NAD(P)-dependent dehydrogenase (short-subunit alcohol dehydrogenase family)
MQGKVCLVTGATSGIGKATALGLARLGATVVLVGRDPDIGKAARDEIAQHSGNAATDILLADLASQASIRQLAETFQQRYDRLDVLVNNAGISPIRRQVTVDGIELTFAVNVLAPFLLTNLLLDRLTASAPARVVNVASTAQSPLNFADIQNERRYNALNVYSQSKLADILFTYELARRLQGTGVTANCLHPGVIATNLLRDLPAPIRALTKLFFATPEKGARTSIYLASSPDVASVTGTYFVNSKPARSSRTTYSEADAKRLWDICAGLTHVTQAATA